MRKLLLSCLMLASLGATAAEPQREVLGRGLVAVKTDAGVYLSWRCLTADSRQQGYNIYRDGVKVNDEPVTRSTNYVDADGTAESKYTIKAVLDGVETESFGDVAVWGDVYKRLHLDRPEGGVTPDNVSYTYSPNDCSVGDVDGDGEYEIFVKWDPSNQHDNSEGGYTGNVYIDCYKLDGQKLWRVDLGRNIRAGAHYTQFMVYDFDGDGKAELACKTAPGTVDGQGKYVLMGNDDPNADYRKTYSGKSGIIITGPEYLTVFNGETGAEITTVSYVPLRSVQSNSSWGDSYGNRCERYLACVAYLDGVKPSLVMCRGYYTHSYLCAWDFDGKNLTQRWLHASTTSGKGAYGEGAHSLTVGDVDGDGCDEIVYGSACIDHDGSLLYRTGAGHGDALHLGDFDPDREGLEVFMVHEEKGSAYPYDSEFRDAKTGEIIWCTKQSGNDIGRGLVGNLSSNYRGYEVWPGSYYVGGENVNATFDCRGELIVNSRPSTCFRLYWDGDLLDELFDGKYNSSSGTSAPVIEKRKPTLSGSETLMAFNKYNAQSCNTTKATPNLIGDILGDWREEVILWDGENSSDLLIFTTTIPTNYKVPCLMQDHNYRMAIAWQNVAYNQPPHLGYYLEDVFSTDGQLRLVSGQLSQTLELGEPMEPIVFEYKNATGAAANNLPDGVTYTVEGTQMTISGAPTAVGTYTFKAVTTGGEVDAETECKLIVTEPVDLKQLAYFPFDEVGATTENLVQGSATAVKGTPTAVDGVKGNAVQLDGKAYYTQEAYDLIQLGEQDFSVEFWFKSTDAAAYIFHKGSLENIESRGRSGKWVGLEVKNGQFKFAIDDNVVKSEAAADASAYMTGDWTHIVCVRESTSKELKLYANGTLIASATDGTGDISDYNEALVIGNVNISFDNTFNGVIDEFVIYSGAMSANKVKARYEEYASAGIGSISAGHRPAKLTLVSATSGTIVRTGVGSPENVTAGVAPGYYILVIDDGVVREIRKFVQK